MTTHAELSVRGKKRSVFSMIRKLMVGIGGLCVIIILIGFTYEQLAKVFADAPPPIGRMVDIGEYKLHMYATGEAHNNRPTIILESGLGTLSSYKDWEVIQTNLSDYTRVISYDRAGYGWSEQASNERDVAQIADDLHELLRSSGETGPFLFVGHSFGGFISQVYASKYKDDVVGLVLIDSSHVEQEGGFSKLEAYGIRFLKEIGVGRLLEGMNMLPVHEHFATDEASIHFFHNNFYNKEQISELVLMMTVSAEQVRAAQADGYDDMPLTVLSVEHEDYPEWSDLQRQLTSLSSNGQHIVVEGAGHYIHLDKPEVVINAIVEMVE